MADTMKLDPNRAAVISSTEVRYIQSTHVDQEFKIFVALPEPLVPDQRYPVLYVLDGNGMFGLATDTARGLLLGMELPPMIVVGIGYPVGGLAETFNLRMRDYTPTPDQRFVDVAVKMWGGSGGETSGGGLQFLEFIRTELKPMIEAEYPADPADATIFGDSFGGLFSTFVLLNKPDTFQRYIIGSPSLFWNGRVMLEHELRYAESHDDLPAKVFVACGALETAEDMRAMMKNMPPEMLGTFEEYQEAIGGEPQMVEILEPFLEALGGRGYPSLELSSEVFPAETHNSVPGLNLCRSLRKVFGTGYFGAA
jgi:predicted alpha/beta superfamily hydrolase